MEGVERGIDAGTASPEPVASADVTDRRHPVRLSVADDLQRSRLTVFFRLLLVLPHYVWLQLWGVVAVIAVVINWFVTLFAGRPADALHRFVGAYVRYLVHVQSFVYLVANPFPGFTGSPGSYPVDLELPPPERQNRWKTFFRAFLALPAMMIAGVLGYALALILLLGWFVALFLGRMPEGLRDLGAYSLRYNAQTWAYLFLLTDAYPFASPKSERQTEA